MTVEVIEPGSVWCGPDHQSRWMVFVGNRPGLFDLWCIDPGSSAYYFSGRIVSNMTPERVRSFLVPE